MIKEKVMYSDKMTYDDLATVIGLFMSREKIKKMSIMCEFKEDGFNFDVLAGE